MKISQILEKIDENQLYIPAFQREYVWKRKNAKDLISSLLNDYPTGTMLTWETNNPPELKGDHEYNSKQGSVKIILDGQQRITTLYMLMTGEIPPYYKAHEILYDPRDLYVNVESLELEYYKKTSMESNPVWVNLTHIFKGIIRYRDVVDELERRNEGERISRDRENVIDDNFRSIEKIKDRDFLEQIIPAKASVKEAIDIFYVVNASGVSLTDAELALAQISGYWPEAREEIKKKQVELEAKGFVFNLDFFVYLLLGTMYNLGSKMERLHGNENEGRIKEVWAKLEGSVIDYSMNIIQHHAYVDHTKEINSVYALVPIITYVFNKPSPKLTNEEIRKIIKWFYYSQIRFRYISQLQQKLDKDLGIVAKTDNPFDALLNIIEDERSLEIKANEFIGRNVQHPLWNLMKFYFKSKNAVCLGTGLSIRKNMGKKYSLEYDHIFAYAVLRDKSHLDMNSSHDYSLAHEMTNRALLTSTENRSKSAELAEVYLMSVKDHYPNSLELQCIPDTEELWKVENYERFLEVRREMLANNLNEFLQNITVTEQVKIELDIMDIIGSEESNFLEFKSTLRWDVDNHNLNKKLESVVLKTIAGFSNGEGGKLVIGVTDDGDVYGLDEDYKSLKKPDRDTFELHLRNLINNAYGVDFTTTTISIKFHSIESKDICEVDVGEGGKPLYTEMADKNGNKSKKFFVRSGNSTQELDIDEISGYINRRFFG